MRVIAIDGPAGSGKSTVGRRLADAARTSPTWTRARCTAPSRSRRSSAASIPSTTSRSPPWPGRSTWWSTTARSSSEASTPRSRSAVPRSSRAVSLVAANSGVREELRARQRLWAAEHGGGVIEGRDIGTVVFPDALLKVYLTADAGSAFPTPGEGDDRARLRQRRRRHRPPRRRRPGSVTTARSRWATTRVVLDTTGTDHRRCGRPAGRDGGGPVVTERTDAFEIRSISARRSRRATASIRVDRGRPDQGPVAHARSKASSGCPTGVPYVIAPGAPLLRRLPHRLRGRFPGCSGSWPRTPSGSTRTSAGSSSSSAPSRSTGRPRTGRRSGAAMTPSRAAIRS